MTVLADSPIFSDCWDNEDDFIPEPGSVYLFASAQEERGKVEAAWRSARSAVSFVEVTTQNQGAFTAQFGGIDLELHTRAGRALLDFVQSLPSGGPLYLDITGMAHATWAPLIRACIDANRLVRAVYTEPHEYSRNPAPTEGDIYDLSERVEGIRAIPGFAKLSRGATIGECFIPLLGFEGTRFAHVREHVQPAGDQIFPVVGVPGFRPEFPFAAYLGNRPALVEGRAWTRVRYARANCPFSLYYLLEDVRRENPDCLLKVAPIGTKPHGLGAVLFALSNPSVTELVYDHPVRKVGRTSGKARVLVYRVTEFMS